MIMGKGVKDEKELKKQGRQGMERGVRDVPGEGVEKWGEKGRKGGCWWR